MQAASTVSSSHTKGTRRKLHRNKSITLLCHRYKAIAITGMEFNKFKYGKAKRRVLWCDPMLSRLYWGDIKDVQLPTGRYNVAKAKGSIAISSITSLVVDRKINPSQCPLFRRRFQESPELCLSILTDERTVDLEADSPAARDSFAAAIGNIAFGDLSMFDLGEDDDDFNDEVNDVKELFESEASEHNNAVEEYSKVYHQRKLSRDIQDEITAKANAGHRRSHSFITKALMDKDTRFRRLAMFVQLTREQFAADRGALYLVDSTTGVVESVVIEGQQGDVRSFQMNQGLVGTVAATGDIMIVPDAYADPRFDQTNDVEISYKTTSVLLGPVRDRAGRVVAVLEFRNKQDHQYTKDYFTVQHAAELQRKCNEMKEILSLIQEHDFKKTMRRVQNPVGFVSGQLGDLRSESDDGGSSAESSGLSSQGSSAGPSRQASPSRRTNSTLTQNLRTTDIGFSLAVDALQEARDKLGADRIALYVLDQEKKSLQSIIREGSQEKDSLIFKLGEGLIGCCAKEGVPIIVEDAYEDHRFDKSQDKQDSYKTTSVFCVPVKNSSGDVIAVAQFINKQDMPFRKGYFKGTDYETVAPVLPQIAAGIPFYKSSTQEAKIFKIEESDEAEMEPGMSVQPKKHIAKGSYV